MQSREEGTLWRYQTTARRTESSLNRQLVIDMMDDDEQHTARTVRPTRGWRHWGISWSIKDKHVVNSATTTAANTQNKIKFYLRRSVFAVELEARSWVDAFCYTRHIHRVVRHFLMENLHFAGRGWTIKEKKGNIKGFTNCFKGRAQKWVSLPNGLLPPHPDPSFAQAADLEVP